MARLTFVLRNRKNSVLFLATSTIFLVPYKNRLRFRETQWLFVFKFGFAHPACERDESAVIDAKSLCDAESANQIGN